VDGPIKSGHDGGEMGLVTRLDAVGFSMDFRKKHFEKCGTVKLY
tara:strand:- start:3407 stop:3538 length:132 start_codon:yes stop_codon:yes gene_type:complete